MSDLSGLGSWGADSPRSPGKCHYTSACRPPCRASMPRNRAMLKVGDTAPDFSLPDHDGKAVRLKDLLVKGPVLLYFYPADFTPVCTREACAFGAVQPELAQAGVSLIGISPQDEATHTRFREHYSLPFPLLADPR